MAQFAEVLENVRLVLTRAHPDEVHALLEGLVEERIISEEYRKSLSLCRLIDGIVPEPGCEKLCDTLNSQGSNPHQHLNQGQVGQVRTWAPKSEENHCRLEESEPVSLVEEQRSTRSRPQVIHRNNFIQEFNEGITKDKHHLSLRVSSNLISDSRCRPRWSDEMSEVLSVAESMQKPASDSESVNKGNLENKEERLEQLEEAARRITFPLWQHWDRGQGMLPLLVPFMTDSLSTSNNMVSDNEAQCNILDMAEEMELVAACRSLGPCASTFECMELGITDPNFTKETSGESGTTAGLNADHFRDLGATENASPAEANTSSKLELHLDVWWPADRTTDELLSRSDSGPSGNTFTRLSSGALMNIEDSVQNDFFYSDAKCSMMGGYRDEVDVSKNDGRTEICEKTESQCVALNTSTFYGRKRSQAVDPVSVLVCGESEDDLDGSDEEERDESNKSDAKMQSVDQDFFIPLDFNLPEDLSEYLDENYLDPAVLFEGVDELNQHTVSLAAEVPSTPNQHVQIEGKKLPGKTNNRRKRQGVPHSQQSGGEITRLKRQRAAGLPKTQEAHADPDVTRGIDEGPMPTPVETMAGLCTTPPKVLHVLSPQSTTPIPIQFITIPDASGYQFVHLASPPPSVITLSSATTAPTYILVPATSPPCQVPPLSPADGTVAPVLMSSSPPGSLSDSASKAMSPPCRSPPSPSYEMSSCKESPQSPTAVDIPQSVKDYIQEAKSHIFQACQNMEAGLTLTSHYVEIKVSQREIIRSGKNTSKCLGKELVLTGDTDLQQRSLKPSQIFEKSNGAKSRHCILLLGNASMGKTTLIKKLCLDWSRDCIHQFDFVFLLDGKKLTLTEPVYSLQTLLLQLSSFASACKDPEMVYAQILAASRRVLVIFDGFDKLRDYEVLLQTLEKDLVTSLQKDSKAQTFTVRQLYSAILQRVLLPGCTLLLSTRPRGPANQLLRRVDSLLEVSGFTPTHVEMYLSQYFTDSELRACALDCLKSSSYLQLLCWNPGLCRLVCMVLEHCQSSDILPRTLTGLCHQLLFLKMEKDRGSAQLHNEDQKSTQSGQESPKDVSKSSHVRRSNQAKSRTRTSSRTQRTRSKEQKKQGNKVDEVWGDVDRAEDREMVSQLGSLAWEGIKADTSILLSDRAISTKVKAFGLSTGLLLCQRLRTRLLDFSCASDGGGKTDQNDTEGEHKRNGDVALDNYNDCILMWASPFLQSYMAAVHLSFSRTVPERLFLQNLPFQTGTKGRRQPQREELELTQQFVVGLLFHSRTKLQRLHSYTEPALRDMLANKQALVTKHLEALCYDDLSPSQVLEACHYVYEASFTHEDGGRDTRLLSHLAANLPESLTFRGVPLSPPDVFTVQNALEQGGAEGRSFCLDLEDSGVQVCGLRAVVSLKNINTYRACIADVIALWEQLQLSGEEELLQGAVSKFKIHPLKATQVCHIEHLAKLVNIHAHARLANSSSQSHSILAEGVPAVKELHKLEFELGPEIGPLALPKLWDLLPGLHNLQHLDLEKSKIGDDGAEELADALVSLCCLEILNLSQNCIGDQGVKKLALTLKDLPRLQCLSLYSNMISDEGAESLAAVLPYMPSLTDLDVKYNKLTDVGAQRFGESLRKCKKMKSLRMWNQCIPCRVFERLQQQDRRILSH